MTTLLLGSTAANSQDSQYIEKGSPAPYTGILFTEKKAQSIRNELLEGDKAKVELKAEQNKTKRLNEVIVLKNEEIDLYKTQNERLTSAKERSDTMNYIWFGMGILATGLAVYGAGQLSK